MSNLFCPSCGNTVQPLTEPLSDVLAVVKKHPDGVTSAAVHAALPQYTRSVNATMELLKRLVGLKLIHRSKKVSRSYLYVCPEEPAK